MTVRERFAERWYRMLDSHVLTAAAEELQAEAEALRESNTISGDGHNWADETEEEQATHDWWMFLAKQLRDLAERQGD